MVPAAQLYYETQQQRTPTRATIHISIRKKDETSTSYMSKCTYNTTLLITRHI